MKRKHRSNGIKINTFPLTAAFVFCMAVVFLWIADSFGEQGESIRVFAFVLMAFSSAYGLFLFMNFISGLLMNWLEQADTGNKRAPVLDVDYVNETVHYSSTRLGEKQGVSFPKSSEKGLFTIDGDHITVGDIAFSSDDIQWLGLTKRTNFVRLDLNIDGWWHRINIHPGYDGDDFLKELRSRVPEKLNQSRYANRPEIRTYDGVPAHITNQTLHGIFEKQESVELHVTPLWLVVLHNGYVMQQHFIDDITDIRCTKHPTDLDDDMLLLSFEVGEEAFAYALKDKNFTTRLSDAGKQGIDATATRKKKQATDS